MRERDLIQNINSSYTIDIEGLLQLIRIRFTTFVNLNKLTRALQFPHTFYQYLTKEQDIHPAGLDPIAKPKSTKGSPNSTLLHASLT